MTTHPAPSLPRLLDGRYRAIERLGRGLSTDTYRAVISGAEGFEKSVVMRRLRPEWIDADGALEAWTHDLQLSMRFSHANIVHILDVGTAEDGIFSITEWVDGEPLAGVLHRARTARKPAPLEVAAWIVTEVAKGMVHALRRSQSGSTEPTYVHGALQPRNIWITQVGGIKVDGWGWQRASALASASRGYLDLGQASPETVRGQAPTPRTDVFAMGALLMELLTLKHPFAASTPVAVLNQVAAGFQPIHAALIRNEAVLAPSGSSQPTVAEPLIELLARTLHPEPTTRPTIGAFAESLETVLTDAGMSVAGPDALAAYVDSLDAWVSSTGTVAAAEPENRSAVAIPKTVLKRLAKTFAVCARGERRWLTLVTPNDDGAALARKVHDRLQRTGSALRWIDTGTQEALDALSGLHTSPAQDATTVVLVMNATAADAVFARYTEASRIMVVEIAASRPIAPRGAVIEPMGTSRE